jgi:hypothetical protein
MSALAALKAAARAGKLQRLKSKAGRAGRRAGTEAELPTVSERALGLRKVKR